MAVDLLPVPTVPREIAALTGGPTISYRLLYGRVLDGMVPAEQRNGRWYIRRQDLAAIAEALGLPLTVERAVT